MNKEILHLFQYILPLHYYGAALHHNSANKDREKFSKCYKHAFLGAFKSWHGFRFNTFRFAHHSMSTKFAAIAQKTPEVTQDVS